VVSGRAAVVGWDTDAVPYDPTIYRGAAAHYRYGRPAYSPGLEAVLTQETGLDGDGRLLDAGCGPGVLTVRLAHLFAQAVGLDPDAGMLAEGRRAAAEKNVLNIGWVQGGRCGRCSRAAALRAFSGTGQETPRS
jgi:SAM-dependent methyltransferase